MDGNRLLASQSDSSNQDPGLFSDNGGYYKFPNGLIMQWGNVYNLPYHDTNIKTYFPISFPHKCFSISSSRTYDIRGHAENQWSVIKSYDNQGFYIYADCDSDFLGKINSSWIAIGY